MAVTVVIGTLRQVGTLSVPTVTSDAAGNPVNSYTPLDPATWRFAIEKASAKAAERLSSATIIAHATHIVSGRFHAGITTKTRLVWVDLAGVTHTADVLDVDNTEGAGVETIALVSEIIP